MADLIAQMGDCMTLLYSRLKLKQMQVHNWSFIDQLYTCIMANKMSLACKYSTNIKNCTEVKLEQHHVEVSRCPELRVCYTCTATHMSAHSVCWKYRVQHKFLLNCTSVKYKSVCLNDHCTDTKLKQQCYPKVHGTLHLTCLYTQQTKCRDVDLQTADCTCQPRAHDIPHVHLPHLKQDVNAVRL